MNTPKDFQSLNTELLTMLHSHPKDSAMYNYYLTKIVNANEAFIRSKTKKFMGRQDYEDILQEARLTLIKTAENFDLSLGLQFSTYAGRNIDGRIKHYMDDNTMLHIGHSVTDKISKARTQLISLGVENPTAEQLSKLTGMSVAEIEYVNNIKNPANPLFTSLDSTISDKHGQTSASISNLLASSENIVEDINKQETFDELHLAIDNLTNLQKYIVNRLFFDNATQKQVANEFGTSQAIISKVMVAAKRNLQTLMDEDVMTSLKCKQKLVSTYTKLNTDQFDVLKVLNSCNIDTAELINLVNIKLFQQTQINAKVIELPKYTKLSNISTFNYDTVTNVVNTIIKNDKLNGDEIDNLVMFKAQATKKAITFERECM